MRSIPAPQTARFTSKPSCGISRLDFAGRTTWSPTRRPSRSASWATTKPKRGIRPYFWPKPMLPDEREVIRHFPPVIHADEVARRRQVVRRAVEQTLAFEALQVARQVVNQIVRAQNALVAAEHVILRRNEGEVPLQPAILRAQRVRYGHGLRGDEHVEALGEFLQHFLRARHQRQVFEEILRIKESAELLLAVLRRNLPQASAGQVGGSKGVVKRLVITAEVLRQRVRHYFVHVHTNSLQCRSFPVVVSFQGNKMASPRKNQAACVPLPGSARAGFLISIATLRWAAKRPGVAWEWPGAPSLPVPDGPLWERERWPGPSRAAA